MRSSSALARSDPPLLSKTDPGDLWLSLEGQVTLFQMAIPEGDRRCYSKIGKTWICEHCAVLQESSATESSAPRADEHAIWDTLRSRKPGFLRAMPSQFENSFAI
jgi:hypothetical protein